MKNTKIIFLFLAIILLMSLFNCSMEQTSQSDEKNEESATEQSISDDMSSKSVSVIYSGPSVIYHEYSERYIGSGGRGYGAGIHTALTIDQAKLLSPSRSEDIEKRKKITYYIHRIGDYAWIVHAYSGRYLRAVDNKIILGDRSVSNNDMSYQFEIVWLGSLSRAIIRRRYTGQYLCAGDDLADPVLTKLCSRDNPGREFIFRIVRN